MLPGQVNILGLTYKIQEVEVVNKETLRVGEINYLSQTIKIDSTMPEERKEQVLIHEILHGIFEALGFDEINENEQMVQSFAVALHQTLKNSNYFFLV